MNQKMGKKRIDNPDEIVEIAKRAFKAHFSDVAIVMVNVKPRLDHYENPIVDVKIVYDGDYEQLKGKGLLPVQREIVSKAWREVEEDLGFPIVHFIAKSDLGRRDPATA